MTSADDAQIYLTATQRLTVLESTAETLLMESLWGRVGGRRRGTGIRVRTSCSRSSKAS